MLAKIDLALNSQTCFRRFKQHLINLYNDEKLLLLCFFATAFFIRLLPELAISKYPVGYESITYYAPALLSSNSESFFIGHYNFLIQHKPLADTFQAGPLLYVFLWFFSDFSGINDFFLLKMTAPILYGCLAVSFFVFTRH